MSAEGQIPCDLLATQTLARFDPLSFGIQETDQSNRHPKQALGELGNPIKALFGGVSKDAQGPQGGQSFFVCRHSRFLHGCESVEKLAVRWPPSLISGVVLDVNPCISASTPAAEVTFSKDRLQRFSHGGCGCSEPSPRGASRRLQSLASASAGSIGYHQLWKPMGSRHAFPFAEVCVSQKLPEPRMFRAPQRLKDEYDVVIIGGGGHGLAAAHYLAADHGIANVAVLEQATSAVVAPDATPPSFAPITSPRRGPVSTRPAWTCGRTSLGPWASTCFTRSAATLRWLTPTPRCGPSAGGPRSTRPSASTVRWSAPPLSRSAFPRWT